MCTGTCRRRHADIGGRSERRGGGAMPRQARWWSDASVSRSSIRGTSMRSPKGMERLSFRRTGARLIAIVRLRPWRSFAERDGARDTEVPPQPRFMKGEVTCARGLVPPTRLRRPPPPSGIQWAAAGGETWRTLVRSVDRCSFWHYVGPSLCWCRADARSRGHVDSTRT